MAISDNTRSVNDQTKLEEFCQGLQQSWAEFQREMKEQMHGQQEQQQRVNNQVSELITGLSQ